MTMALITNVSSRRVDLVVAGDAKDGVPPTASLMPGEHRELDVNVDSGWIKGMTAVGAITVDVYMAEETSLTPQITEGI